MLTQRANVVNVVKLNRVKADHPTWDGSSDDGSAVHVEYENGALLIEVGPAQGEVYPDPCAEMVVNLALKAGQVMDFSLLKAQMLGQIIWPAQEG